MLTTSFRAMGSTVQLLLEADTPAASTAFASVPLMLARWEGELSRFQPDSALCRLNDAPGEWMPVSPVFAAVLETALWAAEATGGLVTPTVLDALERSGYTGDFAALKDAAPPTDAARLPPDWHLIDYNATRRLIRVPQGCRLDFGGVAKGWAAQQIARYLGAYGPALADLGGDIAISGPRADSTPWPIGVGDARNAHQQRELLLIRGGGVATSGRDYRRWQQHGLPRHHIIDPRTGEPASTDLLSVTVVAPTLTEAEAAARSVLVLGRRAGLRWLALRPHLAALLQHETGGASATPNLGFYRWHTLALQ